MGSLLDVAAPFPRGSAFMARQLRVKYPGALYHLTARGNDQHTIVHDVTDRTDFLTRLGQEILPQRLRSTKSRNDPTRVFLGKQSSFEPDLGFLCFVASPGLCMLSTTPVLVTSHRLDQSRTPALQFSVFSLPP